MSARREGFSKQRELLILAREKGGGDCGWAILNNSSPFLSNKGGEGG